MRLKVVNLFIVWLILAAAVFASGPSTAYADAPTPTAPATSDSPTTGPLFGLKLNPGPDGKPRTYFTFTLKPGEKVVDTVILANNSDSGELTLNIELNRGETGLTGGISYNGKTDGPASWINWDQAGDHAIEAGKGLPIAFEVSVPEGTPPGEYIAGFISTNAADLKDDPALATPVAQSGQGGLAVKVIPRVATAVVIVVPEPSTCEINVGPVETKLEELYGRLKSSITMQAVGNKHYRGDFTYKLLPVKEDNSYGEPVFEGKYFVDYFIPGDTIRYPIYIQGTNLPPAGKYHVDLVFEGECKFNISDDTEAVLEAKAVENTSKQAESYNKPQEPAQTQPNNSMLLVGIIVGGVIIVLLLVIVIILLARRKEKKAE